MTVEGGTLRRENYALTLEKIGREGASAFYKGPIADSIVNTISSAGGNLTHHDMISYTAIVKPAVHATYRNRTFYTTHSPSGGPILISLLNTLEGYGEFVSGGRTGLAVHRFVDALKCERLFSSISTRWLIDVTSLTVAFAARTELGDPAFIHNGRKLRELTTKTYGAQIRANITDVRPPLPSLHAVY